MAKDPEAAFFKRLEGLQPCEVSELKAGTHIFAVYGLNFVQSPFIILTYEANDKMEIACMLDWPLLVLWSGDNFFKTASYTIEALCTKSYEDTTEKLKDIEAQILRKRTELRQFETEYRKVFLAVILLRITFRFWLCVALSFDPYITLVMICRHWRAFKKWPTDMGRKSSLYVLFVYNL